MADDRGTLVGDTLKGLYKRATGKTMATPGDIQLPSVDGLRRPDLMKPVASHTPTRKVTKRR